MIKLITSLFLGLTAYIFSIETSFAMNAEALMEIDNSSELMDTENSQLGKRKRPIPLTRQGREEALENEPPLKKVKLEEEESINFENIPNEICEYILSFLSEGDLCKASAASKHMNDIANSPILWRRLAEGEGIEGVADKFDYAIKKYFGVPSKYFLGLAQAYPDRPFTKLDICYSSEMQGADGRSLFVHRGPGREITAKNLRSFSINMASATENLPRASITYPFLTQAHVPFLMDSTQELLQVKVSYKDLPLTMKVEFNKDANAKARVFKVDAFSLSNSTSYNVKRRFLDVIPNHPYAVGEINASTLFNDDRMATAFILKQDLNTQAIEHFGFEIKTRDDDWARLMHADYLLQVNSQANENWSQAMNLYKSLWMCFGSQFVFDKRTEVCHLAFNKAMSACFKLNKWQESLAILDTALSHICYGQPKLIVHPRLPARAYAQASYAYYMVETPLNAPYNKYLEKTLTYLAIALELDPNLINANQEKENAPELSKPFFDHLLLCSNQFIEANLSMKPEKRASYSKLVSKLMMNLASISYHLNLWGESLDYMHRGYAISTPETCCDPFLSNSVFSSKSFFLKAADCYRNLGNVSLCKEFMAKYRAQQDIPNNSWVLEHHKSFYYKSRLIAANIEDEIKNHEAAELSIFKDLNEWNNYEEIDLSLLEYLNEFNAIGS